ncbi:MAG: CPBP family intramembrane metalloprotease [Thermomicrobium sp.]|nr:CPBP family intramembrane metalloprotease [Thermomicrobium sp.]MDW7982566.1 CPBP family intramembrane glutamic endopeptidase [Thermomicrobium sp.]
MDRIRAQVRAHPVAFFVGLTLVLSWAGWLPGALTARGWVPSIFPDLAVLGGIGPAVAAVTVSAVTEGRSSVGQLFRPLLWGRASPLWYALVPGLWMVVATLAAAAVSAAPFPERLVVWFAWPAFLFWFVGSCVANVWEEIGWRGFALPRLAERWGDLLASVWLGLVGFVWHLPLLLDPRSSMSQLPWPLQAVFLVGMAVLLTWVYRGTRGSLVFVTAFHALSNAVALGMVHASLFVSSYPVVVGSVGVSAVLVVLRYGHWRFGASGKAVRSVEEGS